MKHKLAIIGFGGMGAWHEKNISERVPEFEVVGAYDIRTEAKQKIKERGLIVYPSLEALLADPEVTVVTIAVPNNFHKEYAIACLRAKKHVICEKPVTMNAKELEEIIAVAKETNRLFTVHQNRRWDRDFKIVEKIVKENLIGPVYFIESRVEGSNRMLHGWRGHKVNGGGMLYDWGIHLLDQLLYLIDSKVIMVAPHLTSVYSNEVDDNFKVMLQFENGVSAIVEVATNCLINLPRWHVCGKEGTAVIQDFSCEGNIVSLKDSKVTWSEDIIYTEAGPTRTMAPRPEESKLVKELPSVETDWSDYYKNIANVLEGKEELNVTPKQALRVMQLIDLMFQASKEHTVCHCNL